jgi:hypothetical protein
MSKRLFVIQNGTLIGNPLCFNTMSITLNKMSDFHRQLFQKVQQLALISKFIDHLLRWNCCQCLSYFHDLGYLAKCFVDFLDCFPLLQVPSTKIKIKCNECIYIGENNKN